MRINSVPDVKCFCNNKNVLRAQSMLWHFVRHPVSRWILLRTGNVSAKNCRESQNTHFLPKNLFPKIVSLMR